MEREIKFRAWSENSKKMLHDVGVHSSLSMDLSAEDEYYKTHEEGRWIVSPSLGFKIMQHTGLKDKNGKEIYEGDILQDNNYPEDGISNELVRWNNEKAKFETLNTIAVDFDTMEVIGNKYENPELI